MKIKYLGLLILLPTALICQDNFKFMPGPSGFPGQNFAGPEDMFSGGGMGQPWGDEDIPGLPPGVDQDEFYNEVSKTLSESLSTEEGFQEFNKAASEAVREMVSDPELVKDNPELEQLKQALDQDPEALTQYMRDFRDVMADPNSAKEVLQAFDKFSDQQDSPDADAPSEPSFSPPPAPQAIPEKKTEKYEAPKKEVVQLSKVEIKGDWKDILLDRKADIASRSAALHRMVRDFDRAYEKLYWLKNSRDIEGEHLGEKTRRRLESFVDVPGGLSDYAAAVWTATSDDAAAKYFLEQFSGKGAFLEELVDFDESVKELAKVARLAAKNRQKVDRQFEEGIIPPVMTGQEKEVDLRARGSQGMGSRLSGKLEQEFLKDPKLAELFRQNKVKASTGSKAGPPKKDSSYSGYGGGGSQGGYPSSPQAGGGYYSPSSSSSSDRSRGRTEDNRPEKDGGFKSKDKKKKLSDEEKAGQELLKILAEVGRSWPDKDQGFFAKVEAAYNAMEAHPESVDGLIDTIGKEKKAEGAAGIELRAEKNKDKDKVKGARDLVFKKSDLSLAAAGVVKCNMLLNTSFAFVLDSDLQKLNGGSKSLSQPPRPQFYTTGKSGDEKGGDSKDSLGAALDLRRTPRQLEQTIKDLAKTLIGQKQFLANRQQDVKKLIQGFSSKGVAPPPGTDGQLTKNLSDLRQSFERQVSEPDSTHLKHMFFSLEKQSTRDTFLGKTDGQEMLNGFTRNLRNMRDFATVHRVIAPFPGVKTAEKKVHKVLALYEEFLDKACNPEYSGSFSAKIKELQDGSRRLTPELKEFVDGYVDPDKNSDSPGAAFREFQELHQRACVLWGFQDFDPTLEIKFVEKSKSYGISGQAGAQGDEPEIPEGLEDMMQGGGGWLGMIMGHPVTQWVVAGLGMLGIWKIADFVKTWWAGRGKAAKPEKSEPEFSVAD